MSQVENIQITHVGRHRRIKSVYFSATSLRILSVVQPAQSDHKYSLSATVGEFLTLRGISVHAITAPSTVEMRFSSSKQRQRVCDY